MVMGFTARGGDQGLLLLACYCVQRVWQSTCYKGSVLALLRMQAQERKFLIALAMEAWCSVLVSVQSTAYS